MAPIPPPGDLNIKNNPQNINREPEEFLASFVDGHYLLHYILGMMIGVIFALLAASR